MSEYKTVISNDIEKKINRGEYVINQNSGALVFVNTTGQQRVQLTHKSGANMAMTDKVVSTFAPNNQQSLTKGNKFDTVAGDGFEMTQKNMEKRAFGDFTVITGGANHFRSPINESYLDTIRDIAAAKTAPEKQYPSIGNNTGVVFSGSGKPNSDGSGAASGGSWDDSKVDIESLIEKKTEDITEIEAAMGEGGNIKLASVKHVYITAGNTPVNFDSGIIVPKGRSVNGGFDIDAKSGVGTQQSVAVPAYEEKDTSSALPFGDLHLNANGKLNVQSGSGGIDFNTSGNVNMTTSGRLLLGGSEIMIGAANGEDAGAVRINTDRDIFMESNQIITQVAPSIRTEAYNQYTIVAPDTYIEGDLTINGNLRVTGHIYATEDIVAGVGGRNVSLLKHTHPQNVGSNSGGGGVNTNKPS